MKERTFTITIGDACGLVDDQQLGVEVSAAPLVNLFNQLGDGLEVYTALTLQRPGDMHQYLRVKINRIPKTFRCSARFFDPITSKFENRAYLPGDTTEFLSFSDQLDCGEYAEDFDRAWQAAIQSSDFFEFVRSVFEDFKNALVKLSLRDDLIRANMEMVKRNAHPLDMVPRDKAFSIAKFRPVKPIHSSDFYSALARSLSLPTVHSCVYFGHGDLKVLHLMATEQLRRSMATGIAAEEIFPLAAHIDDPIDPHSWGCEIAFYSEGISKKADLFINDYSPPITVFKFLQNRKMSTHIVLSSVPQHLEAASLTEPGLDGVFVYQLSEPQ